MVFDRTWDYGIVQCTIVNFSVRFANENFNPNVICIPQNFAVSLRNKSNISYLRNLPSAWRSSWVLTNLLTNCGFVTAYSWFFSFSRERKFQFIRTFCQQTWKRLSLNGNINKYAQWKQEEGSRQRYYRWSM